MPSSVHKLHAQGNDFLLFDTIEPSACTDTWLTKIAHRRFGLGADQLLFLKKTSNHHYQLRICNQDASRATFCLNALLAVKTFLKHQHIHRFSVAVEDYVFHTDPSMPCAMRIPNTLCQSVISPLHVQLCNQTIDGHHVIHLNEHFVIPCANTQTFDLEIIGKRLQTYPAFPDGINVSCYCIHAPNRIRIRTYERGVGPTLSCGSAALAVYRTYQALHARKNQLAICHIETPGGHVSFTPRQADNTLIYTGACEYIANCLYLPSFA